MEVFTAECCSRCVNPQCTRSNFANSKFESRVLTWEERLFTKVPRMDPSDERFAKIAGQRFLLIDPAGSTPAASQGWVDPRNLESPRIQVPVRRAPQPAPKPEPPAPEAEAEVVEPVEAPQEELSLKRAPADASLAVVNTPVNQGQMIGGRPAPTAAEWTPPSPPAESKVVKTGAKVRLGS
jgi:hypothetical protein